MADINLVALKVARAERGRILPFGLTEEEFARIKTDPAFAVTIKHMISSGLDELDFERIRAASNVAGKMCQAGRAATPTIEARVTDPAAAGVATGPARPVVIAVSPAVAATAAPETDGPGVAARRARRAKVVDPLLESKGWSIYTWATESDVDRHTVNDYMKGRTCPYLKTRRKLAQTLGLRANDLPK